MKINKIFRGMAEKAGPNSLLPAAVIAVLVSALKSGAINLPLFWDESNYALNALLSLRFGIPARPLFFTSLLKGYIALFGFSASLMHMLNLAFSIITLVFVYRTAEHLFGRRTAVFSALIVFFSPLFYAQSGILTPEMLLTMFSAAAFYYMLSGRHVLYCICLLGICLSKESGIVIAGALVVASCLFSLFSVSSRRQYGYMSACGISLCFLIFFFLRGAIVSENKLFYYLASMRFEGGGLLRVAAGNILAFAGMSALTPPLLFSAIACIWGRRRIRQSSIVYPALYFGVLLLFLGSFYSLYKINLPRYWLSLYPAMGILVAALISLCPVWRRAASAFIPAVIIYLIFCSFIPLDAGYPFGSGAYMEMNMSYRDVIYAHQKAAKYVQDNHRGQVIGASWPISNQLRYEELGYVKYPFKVRVPFDKPRADGELSFWRVPPEDMDVLVYSPYSDNSFEFKEYIRKYGWVPEKEFGSRKVSAVVYVRERTR